MVFHGLRLWLDFPQAELNLSPTRPVGSDQLRTAAGPQLAEHKQAQLYQTVTQQIHVVRRYEYYLAQNVANVRYYIQHIQRLVRLSRCLSAGLFGGVPKILRLFLPEQHRVLVGDLSF